MTERTRYAGSEDLIWVTAADPAHNAYPETLLIGGFPFPAMTATAFVIAPMGDPPRITEGRRLDAETRVFLQRWCLGRASASFESLLYDGSNPTCCMFMTAVVGLCLRTRYAVAGDRGVGSRDVRSTPSKKGGVRT